MSRGIRGKRGRAIACGQSEGWSSANIASLGNSSRVLAERIREALNPDPVRAPGPVKRFSKDEIARLNAALAKPEGKP